MKAVVPSLRSSGVSTLYSHMDTVSYRSANIFRHLSSYNTCIHTNLYLEIYPKQLRGPCAHDDRRIEQSCTIITVNRFRHNSRNCLLHEKKHIWWDQTSYIIDPWTALF